MDSTSKNYLDIDVRMLPEYWGRWFVPIEGSDMYRVALAVFYYLGRATKGIHEVKEGDTHGEASRHLTNLHAWLIYFLNETKETDRQIPIPKSKEAAASLQDTVRRIVINSIDVTNRELKITAGDCFMLKQQVERFEEVFARESQEIGVFAVTRKGIYSTPALIEEGEKKFPENLLKVMPADTISDIQEAGRCLAFERPTACAFHICRATEALMLAYYKTLTGQAWPYPKRDWYSYNTQLAAQGAPSTITGRLGEIRQDRNAYAHPDITVPLDEAPVTYELCTGVMFYMAKEIEKIEAAKAAASNPPTQTP